MRSKRSTSAFQVLLVCLTSGGIETSSSWQNRPWRVWHISQLCFSGPAEYLLLDLDLLLNTSTWSVYFSSILGLNSDRTFIRVCDCECSANLALTASSVVCVSYVVNRKMLSLLAPSERSSSDAWIIYPSNTLKTSGHSSSCHADMVE